MSSPHSSLHHLHHLHRDQGHEADRSIVPRPRVLNGGTPYSVLENPPSTQSSASTAWASRDKVSRGRIQRMG
jgi:hypothetical protein